MLEFERSSSSGLSYHSRASTRVWDYSSIGPLYLACETMSTIHSSWPSLLAGLPHNCITEVTSHTLGCSSQECQNLHEWEPHACNQQGGGVTAIDHVTKANTRGQTRSIGESELFQVYKTSGAQRSSHSQHLLSSFTSPGALGKCGFDWLSSFLLVSPRTAKVR